MMMIVSSDTTDVRWGHFHIGSYGVSIDSRGKHEDAKYVLKHI